MTSAIAISGSPSRGSKSRRLLAYALARCGDAGLATTLIDLCELPADDLLGRTKCAATVDALAAVGGARVVATGIYATDAQFGADGPQEAVTLRIDRAIAEALAIAGFVAQPRS